MMADDRDARIAVLEAENASLRQREIALTAERDEMTLPGIPNTSDLHALAYVTKPPRRTSPAPGVSARSLHNEPAVQDSTVMILA